jgi:hypothetical protein
VNAQAADCEIAVVSRVSFCGSLHIQAHRRTQIEHNGTSCCRNRRRKTKARYSAAWKRYRMLRVAFPLVFLGYLPFGYIGGAVFRFFGWNTDFLMMRMLAWVPLMSIFIWRWAFWQCPRRGYGFRGLTDPSFRNTAPLRPADVVGIFGSINSANSLHPG